MALRRFGIEPSDAASQVVKVTPAYPNEEFAPLPPGNPGVLDLSSVITADPADILYFHCIGDSGGVKDPDPQMAVAESLLAHASLNNVDFLYHVGDVVYFNGDASEYYPQFYEPYDHYNFPIFAIPGNHDGDNSDDPSVPSLSAFVENFCASQPHLTSEAKDSNRDAMTQPYVHWSLKANLAYIIGLYSNVPSGGDIRQPQWEWFTEELKNAPTDRVLIVALHHPPYSADAHHGGSANMAKLLDNCFEAAQRWPEMVLTGHVHDYQRFTRKLDNGKEITYIVNGAGGYHNLHNMAEGIGPLPWVVPTVEGLTLQSYCDNKWGYLYFQIEKMTITGMYFGVDPAGTSTVDKFTIGDNNGL